MNKMEDVAKMFGKKLGEPFTILGTYESPYVFTENGLLNSHSIVSDAMLATLLAGKAHIKERFHPALGEAYFYVAGGGGIYETVNCGSESHAGIIAIGNCFRTRAEITNEVKDAMVRKIKEITGSK